MWIQSIGNMAWFLTLFVILIHMNTVEAVERYELDDPEGIAAIVLLVLAIIVCIVAAILFFYIVYKLWNGMFGRRYNRSYSQERIIRQPDYDLKDGSHYSSMTTVQAMQASSARDSVVEEKVRDEKESAILEKGVREGEITTEEVIVTHTPVTEQAQMETQELVIVFDDNDDVVDVFTNVT